MQLELHKLELELHILCQGRRNRGQGQRLLPQEDRSLSPVSRPKGPRANNCHGPRLALIRHWVSKYVYTGLPGRFGHIGYHFKLQDSEKMCPPVGLLKSHQLQGGGASPPDPPGSVPPGPPLAIAAHPHAPPTSNYFRRPCFV